MIKNVKSDDIVVLNNKTAYYFYIYKKLKNYKKIYYYNFFELNLLINGDISIVKIITQNIVENFNNSFFYNLVENRDFFLFHKKNNEKYFFKLNLIDNYRKNNTFILIPPGGRINEFDYSLIRIAKFSKTQGKKIIFLALKDNSFYNINYFDEVYLEDNFINFFERLNSIGREYIFYRGWMHEYLLGALLVSKFKNVVVYLKDWNFASKEEYSFLFENGGR